MLIADMFQHIFKLRYNNRHSFCFESYSQDIESFDQSTLCLFCGFVVWQESLIWKKNSNQISYFLCFVNPLLKKSKSAKIESISSKDKHYRPSHKYGSTFDICNARRYYQNTTNKIDLRFMFLATKGFQTSQWLFYLSLIVYVIKQRKDIDWNLWAWDWNSM